MPHCKSDTLTITSASRNDAQSYYISQELLCYRFVGTNRRQLRTTHNGSEEAKHEAFEDHEERQHQNEGRRILTVCTNVTAR